MKKKVIIISIGLAAIVSLYPKEKKSPLIQTVAFQESSIEKKTITSERPIETSIANEVATAPQSKLEVVKDEQLITKKVEVEFLSVEFPKVLPMKKAERYALVYGNYLKTSFYINEAAAGNIELSRETLSKAFKNILLYSRENSPEDIASALSMIKEDQPQLFQEALSELESPQDEEKIEAVLALND